MKKNKKNKGSCHLSPINTTEVPLKKALWLLSGRHIRVACQASKYAYKNYILGEIKQNTVKNTKRQPKSYAAQTESLK